VRATTSDEIPVTCCIKEILRIRRLGALELGRRAHLHRIHKRSQFFSVVWSDLTAYGLDFGGL